MIFLRWFYSVSSKRTSIYFCCTWELPLCHLHSQPTTRQSKQKDNSKYLLPILLQSKEAVLLINSELRHRL